MGRYDRFKMGKVMVEEFNQEQNDITVIDEQSHLYAIVKMYDYELKFQIKVHDFGDLEGLVSAFDELSRTVREARKVDIEKFLFDKKWKESRKYDGHWNVIQLDWSLEQAYKSSKMTEEENQAEDFAHIIG